MKINKESLPIFRHDLGKFTHFGTIYGATAQLAIAHPCHTEYNSDTKQEQTFCYYRGKTMKRIYLSIPHAPHIKYFSISQLPGYLIENVTALSGNHARVMPLPQVPPETVQWLREMHSMQNAIMQSDPPLKLSGNN